MISILNNIRSPTLVKRHAISPIVGENNAGVNKPAEYVKILYMLYRFKLV
jgi:hypothetical protein